MAEITEKVFSVEEIKELVVETGAAEVKLLASEDEASVKVVLVSGKEEEFHAEMEENRLEVVYEKHGKQHIVNCSGKQELAGIMLYLPAGFHVEAAKMSVAAGNMKIEQGALAAEKLQMEVGAGKLKAENIVTGKLKLEVGAGKVKLKNMHVKELSIECGVGECHYEGILDGNANVGCGVGTVELELLAQESDYNYKVSCALGKVQINENNIGSFASDRTIEHADARGNIKMDCGLGKIKVKTDSRPSLD